MAEYILKNRTKLGSAIDNRLVIGLKELSDQTKVPISKLLDEAIQDLLTKRLDKAQESR